VKEGSRDGVFKGKRDEGRNGKKEVRDKYHWAGEKTEGKKGVRRRKNERNGENIKRGSKDDEEVQE